MLDTFRAELRLFDEQNALVEHAPSHNNLAFGAYVTVQTLEYTYLTDHTLVEGEGRRFVCSIWSKCL